MYVSEKYEFVYMPLQKTGTTSICKYLENFDAFIFKDFEICKSQDINQDYSDGYFKHWLHLPEKYKNFFVFTTIRNPYRRFISLYAERILWNPNKTFKHSTISGFYQYVKKNDFSKDTYFSLLNMNLTNEYCDINHPKYCVPFKINSFIKLEQIEKFFELPFLKEKANIQKLRVSNSNAKFKITPDIAHAILNWMEIDFEIFEYSKNVPHDLWLKWLL